MLLLTGICSHIVPEALVLARLQYSSNSPEKSKRRLTGCVTHPEPQSHVVELLVCHTYVSLSRASTVLPRLWHERKTPPEGGA